MDFYKVWKFIIYLLLTGSAPLAAQEVQTLVYFKDKVGTPFTTDQANRFLGPRSLARRAKFGIALNEKDLPVSAVYMQQLRDAGLIVGKPSKWLNAVPILGDPAIVDSALNFSFVLKKDYLTFNAKKTVGCQEDIAQATASINIENNYGNGSRQAHMIGIDSMHKHGWTGKGVLIAVADAGFTNVNRHQGFTHLRLNNGIADTYNFLDAGNQDVYGYHWHGGGALSCVGGFYEGQFVGGAYNADYALYITEDVRSERPIEAYNWVLGAERADSLGVDLINTSLGYSTFDKAGLNYKLEDLDGRTTIITQAVNIAAEVGILCINSAGNEGLNPLWNGRITAPADALKGLTVGAVMPDSAIAAFSSRGFANVGNMKPDVVAQGTECIFYSDRDPSGTFTGAGTSFSAPLVAGLIGGMMEKYPNVTPAQWIEALHKTSTKSTRPDTSYGYGIPNYGRIDAYLSNHANTFQNQFLIYPNPQRLGGSISVDLVVTSRIQKIEIVNAIGQQMRAWDSFVKESPTYTLSLDGLGRGPYIVRVYHNRGISNSRIVISD
jgi:subtilisin family serine protease